MSENWTEEELKAAVESHVDMHAKETDGTLFANKQYGNGNSPTFNRS
ncbi:hypothetical protein [Alkalimarinus coralli]|nr:hypothetical protein [Alkalimarinus coralli]